MTRNRCSLPRGECPDCTAESAEISLISGRDSLKTSVIAPPTEPSILKQIYDEATDPSRIRTLLESSEARSEVVVSPIKASAEAMISPRPDKRDRWAPLLVQQAEDFDLLLRCTFVDYEAAFRFFDTVTLNRSGKVALLKFVQGCEKLKFHGDSKALFFFLDSNNDGVIELGDLINWRTNRARAVAIARHTRS